MPYDLYGNSYKTRLEAENAEMAQCAEINARYQQKEIDDLRRQVHYSQNDESISQLWQYVRFLENRIKQLENPYAEI